MQLITRQQWGAHAPECSTPLNAKDIVYLTVHYTANASDEFGDPKLRTKAIQSYHMQLPGSAPGHDPTMPWCDIAYNFTWRDDKVLVGRGWNKRSAAQGTNAGNDKSIAIVYLGTDVNNRKDISPLEIRTLSEFVLEAEAEYKKKLVVVGHKFWHSTGCPGNELMAVIASEPWRHMAPHEIEAKPKPYWMWLNWELGEGPFVKYGPRSKFRRRGLKKFGVPDKIPQQWWDWKKEFVDARKK